MKLDRSTAIALAVVFALGYWYASSGNAAPDKPRERPVLRWVVRLAKSALWVALFAEGPPAEPQHALVRAHVGEDGHPLVEHGEGW